MLSEYLPVGHKVISVANFYIPAGWQYPGTTGRIVSKGEPVMRNFWNDETSSYVERRAVFFRILIRTARGGSAYKRVWSTSGTWNPVAHD